MRTALYVTVLLLVLALAGATWLFWVQNSQQEVLTSFELWGGLRWGRTWKAPELVALSAGIGAVFGGVVAWWVTASLKNRRIKSLTSSAGGSESSW